MNGNRDAFYEAMSRNPRMQEAAQSGGLTGAGFQQMFPYGAGNYAFGRAPLPEPAPGSPEQERYLTDLVSNMVFPLSVVGAEGRVGRGLVGGAERSVLPDVARAEGGFLPKDSPERAENFRRWFGESKVVDNEGNPLTVYRGAMTDDMATGEIPSAERGSALGTSYHTTDPDVASSYALTSTPEVTDETLAAARLNKDYSPNIIPANVSIKKPVTDTTGFFDVFDSPEDLDEIIDALDYNIPNVDMVEFWDDGDKREAILKALEGMAPEFSGASLPKNLQQIFGFIEENPEFASSLHRKFDGVIFNDLESGGRTIVPFSKGQVKSKFNRGTYDPKDPNIMRGLIGPGLATGATLTKGNNKNGKTK